MHQALYRTERPEVFDEIIGQEHIVRILKNQVKNGTVSQAYLFTGTRGTGKTTTARILAKAMNCTGQNPPCGECSACTAIKDGTFMDVVEVDAASNNGVDNIRGIIDAVQYPPVMGKKKVYIIDEVHMLSQGAENAFLKILEEPPEHAMFILATTNPEKVRATIKSRCVTLDFRRVPANALIGGMRRICDNKGVRIADEALAAVAAKADGSVRDALSTLEICITASDEEITKEDVLDYLGRAGDDFYIKLTDNVKDGHLSETLTLINTVIQEGKDSKQVIADWMEHYRNLMITKYVDRAQDIINASDDNLVKYKEQANKLSNGDIENGIRVLTEYLNMAKYSNQARILLETAAVEMITKDRVTAGNTESVKFTRNDLAAKPHASAESKQPEPIKLSSKPDRLVEEHPDESTGNSNVTKEKGLKTASKENESVVWNSIVEEVSKKNFSFAILLGDNAHIESYKGSEILLIVKKSKLALAETSKADIEKAAKKLYGDSTYVTIKSDEKIAKKSNFENKDREVESIAEDASKLFGMNVKIKEKGNR